MIIKQGNFNMTNNKELFNDLVMLGQAYKPLNVFLFNAGFPDLNDRCLAILN